MRIGLLPMAEALPNVALMRLSAYHKAQGDTVILHPTPLDQPDRVYISTLYTWQRPLVQAAAAAFAAFADVRIGGSGWDLALRLPPEVDAMPNDYELYGIDYGIGYSSRGCIRHCAWCPVPRAEGAIREDRAIGELLNPRSNRLALLDNNFFASDWRPKLGEIRERGIVVDWPQGNDIRLLTGEVVAALGDLRRRRQLRRRLRFSWDLPASAPSTAEVLRGVRLLLGAGFTPHDLSFCVLVGYPGYDLEEELGRLEVLHGLGIQPFVMVYRDFGPRDTRDQSRVDLARWNNGHAWRSLRFSEYRPGVRRRDRGRTPSPKRPPPVQQPFSNEPGIRC